MRLSGIMQPLNDSREFKSAIGSAEKGKFPVGIYGISDSARSFLINGLYEKFNKKFLVLTHSDVEAKNLYEDMLFFVPSVYYLPSKEVVFYNIDAISGDLRWERLKVIKQMLSEDKNVIVTSIEALAATYIPPELYGEYTFKLQVGGNVELDEISSKLVCCGYERVNMVEGKGEFSVRGGILDIFPPASSEPFRIEFFGDEIDSIRNFNVESQRSIDKFQEIEVFPAKEIILSSKNLQLGYDRIKAEYEEAAAKLKKKKNSDAFHRLNESMRKNLELLSESGTFESIDSYLPYFYDKTATLLDYMKDCIVIVDDTQRCKGKVESIYYEFEENYKNAIQRGSILPNQNRLLLNKELIKEELAKENAITLNFIAKTCSFIEPRTMVNFSQITLHSYHGQLDLLINDIVSRKERGYRTVILSGTRPRGERLVNTLRDHGIESSYKDVISHMEPGEVVITFGSLLKGFEYPEYKVCILSDKEVFGEAKRKNAAKRNRKGVGKIKSFTELKPGDYVVHINYGIGVYKGIKQLEVQGIKKDYLELSYDNEDKLYVPVEQLDLVQRYIGTEGKSPKINKLGGTEWAKAKRKAKRSIEEIAEDLVKLYAIRSTVKGVKFSKDTVWQKQFEEEFPYEETPDQLSAIEDIKKDMESDKVMDRLLCGDVGYGKTEVAMRAAFKSVMEGKQVAVLVPTTILAQQHYNNFVQRFSDFPITIDMISRFRTTAQQSSTIRAVKEGNVDIVIGTHRLLQKDLQFKDLGLLVVDEEQRFGVTHKEKIKNLKKNVDVLTLSATPIPRTLHMSLVGVRDISVIETPPEERYPVQTYVVEHNEQLIRDAILREMSRGGQIYFVYNRVENIQDMASYMSNIVPEARIAVAHGQMNERELESIIVDFMKNEYDILMSTTIIETGMDIQNVNTMIIYDADKMGLSQLYQLRGRVGRSNRMAYCYLTYRKDKVLTEVAEKRLKAIKDFTELGSGFKIALKDLEIRGAGNIMGSAQHGHMSTVGYDLYCKMLEDTIKLIKGEIDKEPVETSIEIKVDAYIPGNFISDEVQKIEVYKKIAAIESLEDLMDVQEELEDRFSDIPDSVNNLMTIAYVRSIGKRLGIEEIKEAKDEIVMTFESKDRIHPELAKAILNSYMKFITFKLGEKPAIAFKLKDVRAIDKLKVLKDFFEFMNKITNLVKC